MSSIQEPKYLYAIIRKPQEGKTFICIENINLTPNTIHLIITMNTLKSNRQFFSRAKEKVGTSICVFNSKPVTGDKPEGFFHAKEESQVVRYLRKGVEHVIMCAHHKRFQGSIAHLLDAITDSRDLNKNVVIHIDEAHKYVPMYRNEVAVMNDFDKVNRIFMYTATPFNIWQERDPLYDRIFICDCDQEFNVTKSEYYFGVKDCEHITCDREDYDMIDPYIPDVMVETWGSEKKKAYHIQRRGLKWLSPFNEERWARPMFDLGDELSMLSFTKHTLNKLSESGEIKEDEFTYNFVPAYVRKFTHYAIKDMILEVFPTSIVVVINGDGSKYFHTDGEYTGTPMISADETTDQISKIKADFPGRPLFVTGFHCVGMSVTFISKETGNFDNVIFSHNHFPSDVQYQLCRFLFNHTSWTEEERQTIKKTKLFMGKGCSGMLENCLKYESQVDLIDSDMSGSLRGKDEVVGNVPIKEKKIPSEKKFDAIQKFTTVTIKKFTVDDEEEDGEEKLEKLREKYREFTGKKLKGTAMPDKDEDGFYRCSAPGKGVHEGVNKMKKTIEGWKNTSNFAISMDPGRFKWRYARVYVAYDDKEDNSSYTWFLRMMEFERCDEVKAFIVKEFCKQSN
jgi:hypothetical protein